MQKISGKKMKRYSIRTRVDFYEVCLSYIIHCLLFYFITILTPFFPRQICGISLTKVKEFRKYRPKGFESEKYKDTDEWCKSKLLFNGFNGLCNNIAASYLKIGDESMRAIHFWTEAKRNLPHLSYIFRKL